jgi:hypothetical protein
LDKTLDKVSGVGRTTRGVLAFDSLYPPNGEPLTARQVGLSVIDKMHVEPKNGYIFEFVRSTKKLKVYYADYDVVADGPLIEVPENTDLAALTGVTWEAVGV